MKFTDVPSWDEYFLSIAKVVSSRSKDPHRKVGSVLINEDKHIVSSGYNGHPAGYADDTINWDDRESVRESIIHAEANALLHCTTNTKNTTLYTTLSPCCNCLKHIAAAGVKKVVYSEEYKDINEVTKLAKSYNVTLLKHNT